MIHSGGPCVLIHTSQDHTAVRLHVLSGMLSEDLGVLLCFIRTNHSMSGLRFGSCHSDSQFPLGQNQTFEIR